MSLETGRRIHANKWVKLPITEREVDDVHDLTNKRNYEETVDDVLDFQYDQFNITNPADLYVAPNLEAAEIENPICEDGEQEYDEVSNENVEYVSTANTLSESDTETSMILEAEVLNSTDSESTDSDDSTLDDSGSSILFDISSGTTLEPDDSTYVPSEDRHKVVRQKGDCGHV